MSDIFDDQKVIVYGTIGFLYEGEWRNAPDDIKTCDGDWYRLADGEDADIMIFTY